MRPATHVEATHNDAACNDAALANAMHGDAVHRSIGAALASGDVSAAAGQARAVLQGDTGDATAAQLSFVAHALRVGGYADMAVAAARQAIARDPALAEAHNQLGLALDSDPVAAEQAYRSAIALSPGFAAAWKNLGNLLVRLGRNDAAIDAFDRALAHAPDLMDALLASATLRLNRGGKDDTRTALGAAERACALAPRRADLRILAGAAHHRLGALDAAERAFQAALSLAPDDVAALRWLARVHLRQTRAIPALALLEQAAAQAPDDTDTLIWLAATQMRLCQLDGAHRTLDRLRKIAPDSARTRYALGHLHLISGDLAAGWPAYEARLDLHGHLGKVKGADGRVWDGTSPLAGKTLLVHAEQGFGDTLQFIRLVPMLRQRPVGRDARIVVMCERSLARLVATAGGIDAVVTPNDARPDFDFHIPLLSLADRLAIDWDDLPGPVPYLHPPTGQTYGKCVDGTLNVGLVWAGRPSHTDDRYRSIAFEALAPVLQTGGVAFHCLQFGAEAGRAAATTLGRALVRADRQSQDFAGTAAVMAGLDLVIGVDTAPIHLAGALGRPVWTLLPLGAEWRWGQAGTATRWYPSMRLYRQPALNDWPSVIATVAHDLGVLARNAAGGGHRERLPGGRAV